MRSLNWPITALVHYVWHQDKNNLKKKINPLNWVSTDIDFVWLVYSIALEKWYHPFPPIVGTRERRQPQSAGGCDPPN